MAEQYTTTQGTISNIQRLDPSSNGNPRFRVNLVEGGSMETLSDASINYAIENPEWKGTVVVFTLTKRGRIVGLRTQDGNHSDGVQG